MTSSGDLRYRERIVATSTHPLQLATRLAGAGLHDDYVFHEDAGHWTFASGALVTISLDGSGVYARGVLEEAVPSTTSFIPAVRELLDRLPVRDWRAYGWAAFELASLTGRAGHSGDQSLLSLVVPSVEVQLYYGGARVRAMDVESLTVVEELLRRPAEDTAPGRPASFHDHDATEFRAGVEAVRRADPSRLQQVVLSRSVQLDNDIDLIATFAAMRGHHNHARSFALRLGGLEATGHAPETLLHVTPEGHISTELLATPHGFRERDVRPHRQRTDLLTAPYEVHELAVAVKAAYEALGTVCDPESVAVAAFLADPSKAATSDLWSQVIGHLVPGNDAWDALGAILPAVTASGVPRSAAYECVQSLEPHPRGLYGGAVLAIDHQGGLDARLVLDVVCRRGDMAWFQTGTRIAGRTDADSALEQIQSTFDDIGRLIVRR
ncbi:chorismate-binding protein [Nocardia amamiensis]|uniref:chorismate-binding protein n=1 Tax=Nocardia TaxID=1817 RepID=UPI0033D4EC3C